MVHLDAEITRPRMHAIIFDIYNSKFRKFLLISVLGKIKNIYEKNYGNLYLCSRIELTFPQNLYRSNFSIMLNWVNGTLAYIKAYIKEEMKSKCCNSKKFLSFPHLSMEYSKNVSIPFITPVSIINFKSKYQMNYAS